VLMTLWAVPAVGAASSVRAHPRAQDAIDDWLAAFNAGSLEGLQAFADRYAKKEGSGPRTISSSAKAQAPARTRISRVRPAKRSCW
jgi:hypothetical protein